MSNGEDAPLAALSEGACGQAFGLGVDLPPGKARTICLPFEANRHLRPQALLFTLGSLDQTAEWRIP
jgi:hypothetical protein